MKGLLIIGLLFAAFSLQSQSVSMHIQVRGDSTVIVSSNLTVVDTLKFQPIIKPEEKRKGKKKKM